MKKKLTLNEMLFARGVQYTKKSKPKGKARSTAFGVVWDHPNPRSGGCYPL